jgi:hypothetical protein
MNDHATPSSIAEGLFWAISRTVLLEHEARLARHNTLERALNANIISRLPTCSKDAIASTQRDGSVLLCA